AAGIAAGGLASGRLDAASLGAYEQRVHHHLRHDMAFSRFIVALIRNRHLNPVWLRALRVIAARASTDPDYAYRAGCVATGLAPATTALGPGMAAKTARQAMASPRNAPPTPRPAPSPSKTGGTGPHALPPREFADWAAGAGQALTELTTQLTRAKLVSVRGHVR